MGQLDSRTCTAPTENKLSRTGSILNVLMRFSRMSCTERYKLTHLKANFETRISLYRFKG
jgi:hypothetical protein